MIDRLSAAQLGALRVLSVVKWATAKGMRSSLRTMETLQDKGLVEIHNGRWKLSPDGIAELDRRVSR